jgi:hypothetical protein
MSGVINNADWLSLYVNLISETDEFSLLFWLIDVIIVIWNALILLYCKFDRISIFFLLFQIAANNFIDMSLDCIDLIRLLEFYAACLFFLVIINDFFHTLFKLL